MRSAAGLAMTSKCRGHKLRASWACSRSSGGLRWVILSQVGVAKREQTPSTMTTTRQVKSASSPSEINCTLPMRAQPLETMTTTRRRALHSKWACQVRALRLQKCVRLFRPTLLLLLLLVLLLEQLQQLNTLSLPFNQVPKTQQQQQQQQQQHASRQLLAARATSRQQLLAFEHHQQQQQQQQIVITPQPLTMLNNNNNNQHPDAPKLIPLSALERYQEGAELKLFCSASAPSSGGRLQFEWRKNHNEQLLASELAQQQQQANLIHHQQQQQAHISMMDDSSSMLRISKLEAEHAGNYTCLARNQHGFDSSTVRVNVNVRLKWTHEPPSEVQVRAGKALHLECDASGQPTPLISWTSLKDRQTINSKVLRIDRAQVNDSGVYECLASSVSFHHQTVKHQLAESTSSGHNQQDYLRKLVRVVVNASLVVVNAMKQVDKLSCWSPGSSWFGWVCDKVKELSRAVDHVTSILLHQLFNETSSQSRATT